MKPSTIFKGVIYSGIATLGLTAVCLPDLVLARQYQKLQELISPSDMQVLNEHGFDDGYLDSSDLQDLLEDYQLVKK